MQLDFQTPITVYCITLEYSYVCFEIEQSYSVGSIAGHFVFYF